MRSVGMSRGSMAREDLRDALRGVHSDADRAAVIAWNRRLAGRFDANSLSVAYIRLNRHNRVAVLQEDTTKSYGHGLRSACSDAARTMKIERLKREEEFLRDPVSIMAAEDLQCAYRDLGSLPQSFTWEQFAEAIRFRSRVFAEMLRRGVPVDGQVPGGRKAKKIKPAPIVPDGIPEGIFFTNQNFIDGNRKAAFAREGKRLGGGLFPGQRLVEIVVERERKTALADRGQHGDRSQRMILGRMA